jgi:hypothetical protein
MSNWPQLKKKSGLPKIENQVSIDQYSHQTKVLVQMSSSILTSFFFSYYCSGKSGFQAGKVKVTNVKEKQNFWYK